jgi:uncharacterized protein (DUF58 family)
MALAALVRRTRGSRPRTAPPLSGLAPVPRPGQGLDLHEIRPWTVGDEVRAIDRNASARRGEPHTRRYRAEREPRHVLVVDLRPPMLFGSRRAFRSVAALEAASLLGFDLAQQGARVDAVALTAAAPAPVRGGLGEAGMRALIPALVHLHDEALSREVDAVAQTLDAALEEAAARHMLKGTLTLFSSLDVPGPALVASLNLLKGLGALRLVRVRDAIEERLPPGRYAYAEGGGARVVRIGRRRPEPAPEEIVPHLSIAASEAPASVLAKLGGLAHGAAR